jgi:NB-ARC domain
MLEELRLTLPRYKRFEDELPMTKALEDALCDMYTEIIIFCARTITFFRNNPNIGGSRSAWSQFNSDFHVTIESLRNHSRRVDEEGDMIRMTGEARSAETLQVIKKLNDVSISAKTTLPCQMVPYGLNPRFFSRAKEVKYVRETLDPQEGMDKLRVMSIYGLGGVGKTQLALHYANTSLSLYDIVAWIPSESQIKMTQALSVLAQKLGLLESKESEDDYQASLKVRDWLNSSNYSFLLIFDNVDKIDILLQVWPASLKGSILVTTRSPAVAAKRSNDIMHLEPFAAQLGPEALYGLTGFEGADDEDTAAAEEICRLLGGLPLAIVQVSEFIRDRASSYTEFLALYQKLSAKILAKGEVPLEYNHTLSTVWELSLHNLPQDASILQKLIAFFDPDAIEEFLLTNADAGLSDERLQFLSDEFEWVGPMVHQTISAKVVLASVRLSVP